MHCLPLARSFKKFGRILRKMMPSYNKQVDWKPLLRGDDKENIPLDFNTSAYFPSSPTSSENSSDFSDWLSPGFRPIKGCNRTFAVPTPFLDSSNTTSPCSSGYGSDIKAPTTSVENAFKIHRDEFCSSFDSLLKPLQSYSSNSDETTTSTIPSFSYSPLSSFNFADWKSFGSEFFDFPSSSSSSLLEDNRLYHAEVRREFESNGTTTDYEADFSPSISSTPMIHRRSQPNGLDQPPRHHQTTQNRTKFQPAPHQRWSNSKSKKKKMIDEKSLDDHCVFCKNNGKPEQAYRSHTVKDAMGRVLCPILRLYQCPICGQDGDKAHTVKYCPSKQIIKLEGLNRPEFKI